MSRVVLLPLPRSKLGVALTHCIQKNLASLSQFLKREHPTSMRKLFLSLFHWKRRGKLVQLLIEEKVLQREAGVVQSAKCGNIEEGKGNIVGNQITGLGTTAEQFVSCSYRSFYVLSSLLFYLAAFYLPF